MAIRAFHKTILIFMFKYLLIFACKNRLISNGFCIRIIKRSLRGVLGESEVFEGLGWF